MIRQSRQILCNFIGVLTIGLGVLLLYSCHDHDHKGHKHGGHDHKGHKGHDHKSHGSHKEHGSHKGHDDHKKKEHTGEIKLNRAALKQVKIGTVKVEVRTLGVQQIAAVGRVTLPPSKISKVGSRVEGRILRWFVKMGQRVRRGQALALIDSPAVGRARANYLRRSAFYRLTKIEYKRTKGLKRTGLASAKRLLAARVALQRAEINFRSARAQLRILGVSVSSKRKIDKITGRFVLPAPSAGEVTSKSQALGAWVNPQSAILQIEDRKQVWVLLEVYARDVPYVRIGQKVHFYGPGLHQHLQGKISYMASRFDHGAQTLEVRVVLPNSQGKLRPNQFLYALIDGGPKAKQPSRGIKALLIPEDAIQRIGQGQVVFVVGDEPGHYQVRTVVTVEAPRGQVRVLYGLKPGEVVVVKGSFILKSELMRASLEGGHGHAH